MLQLQINNYRGISQAHIDINTLTLVAGKNGAGKSSVAESLAACLCGKVQHALNTAGQYVRAGNQSARAILSKDNAFRAVTWQQGSTKIETANGLAPYASSIACGVTDPLGGKAEDRAKQFAQVMQCEPTEADLTAALTVIGYDAERCAAAWNAVLSLGWDGAHVNAKEKGTKLKGQWEQITGANFGTDAIQKWKPACWDAACEALTYDDVQASLAEAEKRLQQLQANAAVSDAERARLQSLADQLEIRVAETEKASKHQQTLQAAWEEAVKKQRDVMLDDQLYDCPHCKEVIQIKGGQAIKPGNASAKKTNAEKKKLAQDLTAEIQRRNSDFEVAKTAYADCHALSSEAHKAKLMLDDNASKAAVDPAEMQGAVDQVVAMKTRLTAIKQNNDAKSIAAQIQQNLKVQEILHPTGLRKTVLGRGLTELNNRLAELQQHTPSWEAIRITEDLSAQYGGRDFKLISASEKFRVRSLLQIFWAENDGSQCVVIDAADILDNPGRKGLADLSVKTGIPVVVCMTANSAQEVPDLSRDGRGLTYWIENGIAARVQSALSVA